MKNAAYQLSKADFTRLHNGKCEIAGVLTQLGDVVHPRLIESLEKAYDLIDEGMHELYNQEQTLYENWSETTSRLADAHNLVESVWSIVDVDDFDEVPFPHARWLVYEDYSRTETEEPIKIELPENATWLDLWKAANKAIVQSGDSHHIYIEDIRESPDGRMLHLFTGS